MLSIEQIKADNLHAAAQAARNRKVPLVSWPQDSALDLASQMPYLGNYVPEGWTLEDTYLVDASGWGAEDEPALTLEQFGRITQEFVGHGWAVVEAGEFQVVVGRFTKESK